MRAEQAKAKAKAAGKKGTQDLTITGLSLPWDMLHSQPSANRYAKVIGLFAADILAENAFIWECPQVGACRGTLPPHLL